MEPPLKNLTENPVVRSYIFYAAILVLKMMFMTVLTTIQRFLNNAFISEEDAEFLKVVVKTPKVSRINEKVERVRRGHRNDMENIYLFLIIGVLYTCTAPDPFYANLLFLVFTVSRCVHTFVYTIVIMPQPFRGCSWLIGYFITGYMAIRTLIHFSH